MEKCCGTIIIDNGKVLIIKMKEGHFGFPKGHMEIGETEIETALRETKEETNLDVLIYNDKRYINSYTMKNGIYKEVIFFLAKPINKNIVIQESEVVEYKWVLFDDVENYFIYQNSFDLWNEVKKDIYNI